MFVDIDLFLIKKYNWLKERKDFLILRLLDPFAGIGLIADVISLLGLVSGILAAIFMHYSRILFVSFWAGKRLADIFDGPMSRLNKEKIFRNVNMDDFCDITFSLILFIATIPVVGYVLPLLAIVTHLIHLKFDVMLIRNSILAPKSDYAQICFLFGLFREGLIIQLLYTIVTFVSRRLLLLRKGEVASSV